MTDLSVAEFLAETAKLGLKYDYTIGGDIDCWTHEGNSIYVKPNWKKDKRKHRRNYLAVLKQRMGL
jgi:hypothetical protein